MGIDRQALVKDALGGQAEVGYSPIPKNSWAYDPPAPPEYNPSKAKQLLADAGWSDGDSDGVLENGSSRLSFPLIVNANDPQRIAVATEIARQLREMGVQVAVQQGSPVQVGQALASQQFTAALFGWQSPTGDPDCFALWHSSGVARGLNFMKFQNQKSDSLLSGARENPDLEGRKDLYAQFQKVFADQVPAVVLYYPRYHFAVAADVHGVQPLAIGQPSDRLDGLSKWFVEVAGRKASPTPSQ
jgi:peptide/nickel transport system substrate-binding protein